MGPGRYKFEHFLKIGGIMAIITWLVSIWLTPLIYPFH
jgi:di/tricarboxylate transporter